VSLIQSSIVIDYEDAFTELALLGQNSWNDDEIKKHLFVQNAQNIGLVDTVFEEPASDKSCIETAISLDHMPSDLISKIRKKLQDARQIHNTNQLSNGAKKDKVKKVLALINEIQIQDSCSSDKESVTVPPTKTAMVCKLAQIPPEIWMTLLLEAEKCLLNEIKCQQQEDDKMNKSLALSKSTAVFNDKDTNNSNLPSQYARVKNVAKGEDVIKENRDQTYAFVAVDEFLEESMKRSSLYEADEDVDYEYWSSNHHAHATLSISNSLQNKCMNLLHLPEKYHISILDGGAGTCVLGQGWEVLSVHNTRRANVV
jgi:hypothetical protein